MSLHQNVFRLKFSKQEDKIILSSVKDAVNVDWNEVAELLPGRNARQCKDRYEKYLSPNINVSPFTQEEDKKLLSLRELYGPKWILISKHFNNRSDNSLKSRYKLLMRQNKIKENQKIEMDKILQTIFNEDGNVFTDSNFFEIS